ncbi:MAG: copper amine oxidase N-terminal domain-containing protein, partial [Defluviitaleaceae bacterium]|nr:copper amine oxidase N-terminal domain-containing protein [Defluviitaleaceae bacterium]
MFRRFSRIKLFRGKPLAALFLAALFALAVSVPLRADTARSGGAQSNVLPEIAITLNGRPVAADTPPFIDENGRVMVPVRFVSEALGAKVDWDEDTQTATVTSASSRVISVKIGSRTLIITDNDASSTVEMDTAAVIANERTFVPLRYIAEALGLTVGWDAAARTAVLVSGPLPSETAEASAPPTATPAPSPSQSPAPSPSVSSAPDIADFSAR